MIKKLVNLNPGMHPDTKLPRSYYQNENVVQIARDLLGKTLFTNLGGAICGGIITETEAYEGVKDRASHAYNGRRTGRTEIMYMRGGHAYVYLCYGMHALFNIVTGPVDTPHAVLIRGIKAIEGIDTIKTRLGKTKFGNGLITGPGKLTKAMGITVPMTGTDLLGDIIWIGNNSIHDENKNVIVTTRIGISYAGPDALLPYRFVLCE